MRPEPLAGDRLNDRRAEEVQRCPAADEPALEGTGAQVLDVRDGIDFEGGHLRRALNVALNGSYATWAGSLVSHDQPIVVIAEDGGEAAAVMRLGRIGFDLVGGYKAWVLPLAPARPAAG